MSGKDKTKVLPVHERCRKIFGNAQPVKNVWEHEFDYDDAKLCALAATDWQLITGAQLRRLYLHNLSYNEPMQPELFRYLFPLCLATWHEEVIKEGHGCTMEFFLHALRRPFLWQEMMNSRQRQDVKRFIVDTVIARMEREREEQPGISWLLLLNEAGGVAPVIADIWRDWWQLDTPGKAVCLIIYAAFLVYPPGDVPVSPGDRTFFTVTLFYDFPWLAENLAFLQSVLTVDSLLTGIEAAVSILHDCSEEALARRVAQDARNSREIIAIQIDDLLEELAR